VNGYKQSKTITLYLYSDLELWTKVLDELKIEYIQEKSDTFLAIADITFFYELGDIRKINNKLNEYSKEG